ncbi:MAG: apolipoprotein N-acyltransferase, partial [Candidatus Eremiobacteraeota bacterium]|nr:apolipoprotein N-acyltransferase [Candidatus Eremiobacteraeota bacterium]
MSAVAQSTKTSLRTIVTSAGLRYAGVAALSAVALALAFPKFDQAWLAPLGAAGLFWLWERLSWKRAFAAGWFSGFIFFAISFSWITHALGADLGLIAPLIVVIVAAILALYVGLAGAFAQLAYARAHPAVAPLASAASFTIFEWLRSIGPLGVPFEILGYTQVETPLRVYAPYIGAFGVTFVVCVIGAYIAQALVTKGNRALLYALAVFAASWFACWLAWPARHAAPGDMRVAAIQGNIPQSLKWGGVKALDRAMGRYGGYTQKAASFHPEFVAWPETAATVQLNYDAQNGPRIMTGLQNLARSLHTTLAVGSLDVHNLREFNAVYVFGPNGYLKQIYDKRQLVPFAEVFPGRSYLGWLPGTSLISDFGIGHDDAVIQTTHYSFAPVICW